MTFGLEVRDANGNVTLDSRVSQTRLVLEAFAYTSGTVTKTYNTTATISAFFVPTSFYSVTSVPLPPTATVSGNSITISGGNMPCLVLVLAE